MVGREEWRDFGGCWYHILSSPDSHIKTNAENPKKIEKGAKLQVLRPKGYKKKKNTNDQIMDQRAKTLKNPNRYGQKVDFWIQSSNQV